MLLPGAPMVTQVLETGCSDTTEIYFRFSFWIWSIPIILIHANRKCVAAAWLRWERKSKSFSAQQEFLISIDPPPEREFPPVSPNISFFYLVSKVMWGATFQSLDAIFQHTRLRATSEHLERPAAFAYRGRRDSGSEFISIPGGD